MEIFDLPTPRTRDQGYAWAITASLLLLGTLIGGVPLLFDDEATAREILVTGLVGLGSLALSFLVVQRMKANALLRDRCSKAVAQEVWDLRWDPLSRFAHEQKAVEEGGKLPLRLTQVDLREAVLPEIDLSHADLTGAVLRGAVLSRASLRNSNLAGADLRKADLRFANLEGSILVGASLVGASLHGARLDRANLEGADLRDADLTGASQVEVAADERTSWPEGDGR